MTDEQPDRPVGRVTGDGLSDERAGQGRATPSYARIQMIEYRQGRRPGQRYLRIVRPFAKGFRRGPGGELIAREEILEPRGGFGRIWFALRRLLIGAPIPTARESQERLSKTKALAIFSSDALSSIAYGPEEIMKVLVLAGVAALSLTLPVAIAIVALLAVVVTSYQQTIQAYPSGGGSYAVASANLGKAPGLVAAAALLIDYILTVAVSTAAGITAITSAFPDLYPFKLDIIVASVLLVMLANLRGLRESGSIFAVPAYVFIASMLTVIGLGLARVITLTPVFYTPPPAARLAGAEPLTLFLVLSSFAQGCSALTGIEAIANGVQAFKAPEARNARITLITLGVLLGLMVLGVSLLASHIGVIPDPTEQESVVSQIARSLVGLSPLYYVLQFATMLILVLAANTSFAGFPRLTSILAQDRFLPRQFTFRGDRLAYSTGIVFLAAVAIGLLLFFRGSVDRLIPLYAVGVFTAFTLSQFGMVQHWRRTRGSGWQIRAAVNGLGAIVTGVVVTIIAITKFEHGAWMVIVLIPMFVLLMNGINRYYTTLAGELAIRPDEAALGEPVPPAVIVPVSRIDRANLAALNYARAISTDVTAVHVANSPEEAEEFRSRWRQYQLPVELMVIDSPYRALMAPLLAYIDMVDKQNPRRPLTVVIASLVSRHWWEALLHNQVALRLKLYLLFRPHTIVVDVPYFPGEPGGGQAPLTT